MSEVGWQDLARRLMRATGWQFPCGTPGVDWQPQADGGYIPDPLDGGTMRAALEWAREVTGDCWLAVRPAEDPDGALWWEAMTVGPSEDEVGRATWSATEAEAHVALAEWAAEFRKAHKGLDD
jgi:hypothetical protein